MLVNHPVYIILYIYIYILSVGIGSKQKLSISLTHRGPRISKAHWSEEVKV